MRGRCKTWIQKSGRSSAARSRSKNPAVWQRCLQSHAAVPVHAMQESNSAVRHPNIQLALELTALQYTIVDLYVGSSRCDRLGGDRIPRGGHVEACRHLPLYLRNRTAVLHPAPRARRQLRTGARGRPKKNNAGDRFEFQNMKNVPHMESFAARSPAIRASRPAIASGPRPQGRDFN